jgi:hypothetical protein
MAQSMDCCVGCDTTGVPDELLEKTVDVLVSKTARTVAVPHTLLDRSQTLIE